VNREPPGRAECGQSPRGQRTWRVDRARGGGIRNIRCPAHCARSARATYTTRRLGRSSRSSDPEARSRALVGGPQLERIPGAAARGYHAARRKQKTEPSLRRTGGCHAGNERCPLGTPHGYDALPVRDALSNGKSQSFGVNRALRLLCPLCVLLGVLSDLATDSLRYCGIGGMRNASTSPQLRMLRLRPAARMY